MIWPLLRSLLFLLPPEEAHELAFMALETVQKSRALRRVPSSMLRVEDERLRMKAFGLEFPNPLGIAAGFDKDGRVLPMWHALGFGFAEMGTVTLLPQPGNPRPRLFRLKPDRALINRMGFNNRGGVVLRDQLLRFLKDSQWPDFPVGINLGKGKETPLDKAVDDYTGLLDLFLDLGDYFVVNVSSPNTPGLRELQEKGRMDELLGVVQAKVRTRCRPQIRPLLVKVAPDLEWGQLDDVLELCLKHGVAGVIATNTTLSRHGLTRPMEEKGGLSGRPLRVRSSDFVRHIHQRTQGKLGIIGVGGIFTAEDAYEKMRAGASLVQVYTGFVYEGPVQARRINSGLVRLLERDGFQNLSQVVGK